MSESNKKGEMNMKTYEAKGNGRCYEGEFDSIESAIESAKEGFALGRYELYEEGEYVGAFYVKARQKGGQEHEESI